MLINTYIIRYIDKAMTWTTNELVFDSQYDQGPSLLSAATRLPLGPT
jgi:hypothetical protein